MGVEDYDFLSQTHPHWRMCYLAQSLYFLVVVMELIAGKLRWGPWKEGSEQPLEGWKLRQLAPEKSSALLSQCMLNVSKKGCVLVCLSAYFFSG